MYPEERSLVKKMQGRPFVLLGVNTDSTAKVALNAVKKNKLNWRSFYDGDRAISQQFQIRGFPTIMLIDHTGTISAVGHGFEDLDKRINKLVRSAEDAGMEGEKFAPVMRTFRDRTGEHKIEAIAESMNDDRVKLRKNDGGSIVMDLVDLSRTDQSYLKTVDVPELEEDESTEIASSGDFGEESTEEYRTFVDSTGKFKVEAVFVKLEDGKVTIRKRDGETKTLPLDKLSEEDQEFIKNLK